MRKGGKGGPGTPEKGKDKQSMPKEGRNNMGKMRRISHVGCEEGLARTE
jgi:hypothetical protein